MQPIQEAIQSTFVLPGINAWSRFQVAMRGRMTSIAERMLARF